MAISKNKMDQLKGIGSKKTPLSKPKAVKKVKPLKETNAASKIALHAESEEVSYKTNAFVAEKVVKKRMTPFNVTLNVDQGQKMHKVKDLLAMSGALHNCSNPDVLKLALDLLDLGKVDEILESFAKIKAEDKRIKK